MTLTDIAQIFRRHEMLLTGANGFLGKVVMGLLLDRYPELKHLHVLVRRRGTRSARERFAVEVLQSPPLKEIVERRGAKFISENISVWEGDAAHPDCGLSSEAIESFQGRVGLIINSAGLVEFFPPIVDSFSANVDAVENLIGLAKRIDAKLLHVSTCYVAGKADGLIEETEPIAGYYPKRRGPSDDAFDAAAELSYCRERIAEITVGNAASNTAATTVGNKTGQAAANSADVRRRLIDFGKQRAERWGWVNTYTYSKSLGEQLLVSEPGLDFTIVRPAIVESSLRFPFPGWIEGGRTAAPLVLMALGGMTDWPVRPELVLEVVPVDLVAGAILSAGALLLDGKHERVYQLGTADVNPFPLGQLVELLYEEARRAPRNRSPAPWWLDPFSRLRFLSPKQAADRRKLLQRRAERAGRWLGAAGRFASKVGLPGARSLREKVAAVRALSLQASFREQTLDQYLPFIVENDYVFESQHIRRAYERIAAADRERLAWDPESIDWRRYWRENQIEGVRRWVQPEAVREWTFKL